MKMTLLFLIFLLPALLTTGQTKNFIDQPYIDVQGNADTLVDPDQIFINIMISEADTKDKIQVEDLENQMKQALHDLGVDVNKELTVSDMTSNFKNYLLKGKDILKSRTYLLKVDSAEMAASVFTKLESLGISNSSIDHVDLLNKEAILKMVLSKAIQNAHGRAVALVDPLDQHVGRALNISYNEPVATLLSGEQRLNGIVVAGYAKKYRGEQLPQIEFKKISVSVDLDVKFALE